MTESSKESSKKAYTDKLSGQLKEWNTKVDKLKSKGVQVAGNQLEELKTKEAALRKRIDEIKTAGLDKFEILKTGTESMWTELKNMVDKLTDKK